MRQARFKRNRGVYKCHTFGTLQTLTHIVKYILYAFHKYWQRENDIKEGVR